MPRAPLPFVHEPSDALDYEAGREQHAVGVERENPFNRDDDRYN